MYYYNEDKNMIEWTHRGQLEARWADALCERVCLQQNSAH